jgi:hypothetical protein
MKTKNKKGLYVKLVSVAVALIGGWLLGTALHYHYVFLAAIDLIVSFGLAMILIILGEGYEGQS